MRVQLETDVQLQGQKPIYNYVWYKTCLRCYLWTWHLWPAATRTLMTDDSYKLFSASKSHFQTIPKAGQGSLCAEPSGVAGCHCEEGLETSHMNTPPTPSDVDKDSQQHAKG